MKDHISRGRLRVGIVVVAVVMIAAVGTPTVSAQQDVSFEYDSEPAGSATVEPGNQYTHTFDVQTNATNGPLIMVVYYNTSADFTYDSHTVRVNGSTTIPTQLAVDTTTVDGQKLKRIQLTNGSVVDTGDRTYNVEVVLSALGDTGTEIVYSGGTHGPSGEIIPLKETDVTIESSGGNNNNNNNGGGGGGGGGQGGGLPGGELIPPEEIPDEPPTLEEVRERLEVRGASTNIQIEITDTDPDSPGITIDPDRARSVEAITINNEEATGSVDIREWQNPPETVDESVAGTIQNDEEVTEAVADEADLDIVASADEGEGAADDTTDGDTSESDPAVTAQVVTVADIEPDSEEVRTSSASVTMTASREELEDPQEAVIVHETQNSWEVVGTTVEERTEDEIVLEGDVVSFSLFAVAEIEATETASPAEEDDQPENRTNETETETTSDDTDTEDSSEEFLPGFGIGVALVALLAVALFGRRRRS